MRIIPGELLGRGRADSDAIRPAIECDSRAALDDERRVKYRSDVHAAKIICRTIVGEDAVIPAPAGVTETPITKAVIDAAIETHMRTPISAIPEVRAVDPTPISRGP